MFVAVATRTMASARQKISTPDGIVRTSMVEIRARNARLREEQEAQARAIIERQRNEANEAIRRANEVIRSNRVVEVEQRPHRALATFDIVLRRISRATGIHPRDILGPSRARDVSFARQAVMYWARRLAWLSLPQIAREIGRDHTTVLHGKRIYPERRAAMGRTLRSVR
jgi:chromosomal replication initiation ATPase DnaA